jgi:hypothetical protein
VDFDGVPAVVSDADSDSRPLSSAFADFDNEPHMQREEIESVKTQSPTFESNKAAQDFVDTANLADYDLSGGTPL